MKKKIILSVLVGATTSLMALGAEHASLYKDPRIMGMGGANVAVGGYSTSVFSNPSGLATIKKEHGFVVDLLGFGLSASKGYADLVDDLDATDGADDETQAILDVLDKYAGEHFHVGVDNYSAVSKNSDMFAWSIGILAAVDINMQVHPNGSLSGGAVDTSSRSYGGVVLGAAKQYDTEIGRVDVGVGLKYIQQTSYEGSIGIAEIEDEDVGDYLQENYEKESSGVGLDIGATYFPFADSSWHPAVGLSILNIGSMDMDDNYGKQPMTVNIGVSVTPEVSYVDSLVLALDYVDMFNANETRIYVYDENSNISGYNDYEESDMMKRIRLGAAIGLIDSTYFSATLNLGLYQSAYTAGLDMHITALTLSMATYEEQVGTGSVDTADRRYIAKIGIGW